MKLLKEDKEKIQDHFNSILRQDWIRSKRFNTLKITAMGYCKTYPESTWDVSELYTQAKRKL